MLHNISSFIGHKLLYADIFKIVGELICNTGMVIIMHVMVNSAENAFMSMKMMDEELQDKLRITEDKFSRRDIKHLIKKLEKLTPISAAGYFDIQKSCLTSMFSIR